jgi:hypothetical protein
VIPVPEDLQITAGFLGDTDAQKELERKTVENLKKYGAGNWYDFCTSRWGTKWDVDPYDPADVKIENNTIEFGFDSAWAPPVGIYQALVDDGFEVEATYYEPGMAFVGRWFNGDDECYEYGGETSDTVRDTIGEELDDEYGISESMREYEEENKDETTKWYEDGVESKGLEPHK